MYRFVQKSENIIIFFKKKRSSRIPTLTKMFFHRFGAASARRVDSPLEGKREVCWYSLFILRTEAKSEVMYLITLGGTKYSSLPAKLLFFASRCFMRDAYMHYCLFFGNMPSGLRT